MMQLHPYSKTEEIAHSLSHALGALIALIALPTLLSISQTTTEPMASVGVWVFCVGMMLLYIASTLYHAARPGPMKQRFRRLDHAAIFIFIAASYTPFFLIVLEPSTGAWMTAVLWVCALGGIAFKFTKHAASKWSVVFYLGLGWVGVFFIGDIFANLSDSGANLLLLGGISYTIGVIFYVWEKLPYNHAIWHLFVLGGSCCHLFCVYDLINSLPTATS